MWLFSWVPNSSSESVSLVRPLTEQQQVSLMASWMLFQCCPWPFPSFSYATSKFAENAAPPHLPRKAHPARMVHRLHYHRCYQPRCHKPVPRCQLPSRCHLAILGNVNSCKYVFPENGYWKGWRNGCYKINLWPSTKFTCHPAIDEIVELVSLPLS